jgi:hypothetical protein
MESKQVSGKQALHYRNYRRARDRALVRLAHLYPDDYKLLLVEERKSDEQQGKTWTGSIDDTRLTITTHTRANAVPALTTSAGDQSQDEGYNGGEA